MILNDRQIKLLAYDSRMIKPFHDTNIRELYSSPFESSPLEGDDVSRKVISYGLSSFGYDIRLSSREFEIFNRRPGVVIDPKKFESLHLEAATLEEDKYSKDMFFMLPAHTYGLGVTLEEFKIPRDVVAICVGKSTYARLGILINTTPTEPGWEGHLTLEISNISDSDCRIYANEGIAQMLFFQGDECAVSYADRKGKYQNQAHEVTHARV